MNDKDFDKIFGDKLREERSFSSQDKDWEQLSTRLDSASQTKETEKKRRNAAWLWLLLLPILPFLLWQMNDIKNQNKQLARQLAEVQSQLAAQSLRRDTIVQRVLKTDTVIIYKYIPSVKANKKTQSLTNISEKNNPTNPSILSPQRIEFSQATDFSTKKTTNLNNALPLDMPQSIVKQDTSLPKQSDAEKKIAELLEKLAALDNQMADLKQALMDSKVNAKLLADAETKQDSLQKRLDGAIALSDSLKKYPLSIEAKKTDKPLQNNRLFIGLQGGQISYRTTWINTFGIDIYKDIKSYQVGLKLEYALTDKLRVVAEGNFCPFSFVNFWQDSRYNLPAMQLDVQKEKFLRAETKQKLLQGNIGVKYLFTEESSKWRPFASVAYNMMRINPFETKYTYQALWGGTAREDNIKSAAVNIPNLLMLSGGLEYRFSKYGVAHAEAFYDKDVNKKHKTFDLFGLRAAVLLNIK